MISPHSYLDPQVSCDIFSPSQVRKEFDKVALVGTSDPAVVIPPQVFTSEQHFVIPRGVILHTAVSAPTTVEMLFLHESIAFHLPCVMIISARH